MKWLALALCLLIGASAQANFTQVGVNGSGSVGGSCWTTGADGWTVICSTTITSGTCAVAGARDANGTCYVAVSASGVDGTCDSFSSVAAARAAPCLHISTAIGKIRSNSDDHLLVKKGDTFTDQVFASLHFNGISSTRPIAIIADGTGARPLVKTNPSLGEGGCVGTAAGGGGLGTGNNIAFIGIECYNYTRDPANIGAGFDPTNGAQSCTYFGNTYTWLLIEDVKCSYYVTGIAADGTGTAFFNNTKIRRSIFVHMWQWNSHSACMHGVGNYSTFLIEENLFDTCGWEPALLTPVTATITISNPTITANFGFTMANNMGMTFHANGDTLPTGFVVNTVYFIVNVGIGGANTFQLSATQGGTAITPTGSQSGTHKIAWDYPDASPQASSFNHAIYLDSNNSPATVHGNIITNSSNVAHQIRNGGNSYNNLVALNPDCGFAAGTNSTIHDGVCIEGQGHTCNVSCPNQSDGPSIIAGTAGSITNMLVTKSIGGGGTAIYFGDGVDDCGDGTSGHGFLFTLANPTVATLYGQIVQNGQAVAAYSNTGSSTCTSGTNTLPSHIVQGTPMFVSNNSWPGSLYAAQTFNLSLTSGGALISTAGDTQSGVFGIRTYAQNSSITGNTIYAWGNSTGNANIGNTVVQSSTNTVSGNTNVNSGGGSFPDNTRAPGSYNAQISFCASLPAGCTATTAAFITNAAAQSKDNWHTELMAKSANAWIGAGFGMTFN